MSPLWLYRQLTNVGAPLIEQLLRRRLAQGKEDAVRLPERRGIAGVARPSGHLIWLHAASVGEAQSSLALIRALLSERPDTSILQTTGTLTSARLMEERLPDRSFHQFIPVDRMPWVRRFLDHWQPDLALWMESELWPNLVLETARRGVPSVLVNARMSPRTFKRWSQFSGSAGELLGKFDLCLAQTEEQAGYLRQLGAKSVKSLGNLKFSADPLPVDGQELSDLRARIATRPMWLAASTHSGEEELAAEAHERLVGEWPQLLTIIVPRHPARGAEVERMIRARGVSVTRRAADEVPNSALDSAVYIADTLGELGLFYRLAEITYVGGSMDAYGGHNPLEPAQLNCAVIHGPDMGNFKTVAQQLSDAGGSLQITDAASLAASVALLLGDTENRAMMTSSASRVATENADAVVRIHEAISRLMTGD